MSIHIIRRLQRENDERIARAARFAAEDDDRARRRRTLAELPPMHRLSNREWLAALDAADDYDPRDDDPPEEWQIGGYGAADDLDFGGLDATGSEDYE